jgi:type I restriction enzyme S subunit
VKAGWTYVALGEVATITRRIVAAEDIADGTTYVGLEHMKSGGVLRGVGPVRNGELASAKFAFDRSHVLYGKLRPNLGKIARPDFEGVCSTDILPISPDPKLDRAYLAHFLARPETIALATRRASGANLPRLSPRALAEFRLPLPPLDEQRRLARILDAAKSLRTSRTRGIESARDLAQSFFAALGGVAEAGHVELGDLVSPERPITYGVVKPGPHVHGGIPYVRVVDIVDDGIRLAEIRKTSQEIAFQYRRSSLKPGDILMSIRGHVGRLAVVPRQLDGANITQDSARIAVRDFEPRFVIEAIRSPAVALWISKHVKGVAVQGINLADVRRIPIPDVSVQVQREFASWATAADRVVSAGRAQLAEFDALFASLQNRAFSGRL